ncbi:hypothetical protein CK216_06090 [Mesorhizobium sp. WSM3876]|nr:hypothetical protein CK216_06090 [Mesorhizobium sp. WSM3876]
MEEVFRKDLQISCRGEGAGVLSPLEGEMSPKATEGVAARESPALPRDEKQRWRFVRDDPL